MFRRNEFEYLFKYYSPVVLVLLLTVIPQFFIWYKISKLNDWQFFLLYIIFILFTSGHLGGTKEILDEVFTDEDTKGKFIITKKLVQFLFLVSQSPFVITTFVKVIDKEQALYTPILLVLMVGCFVQIYSREEIV